MDREKKGVFYVRYNFLEVSLQQIKGLQISIFTFGLLIRGLF
jgi:hypothetical protein